MKLTGKTVLIVGGAGFLGSHLAEGFLGQGASVRVFDVFSSGSRANLASIEKEIEFIRGDANCYDQVRKAAKGVDVIIHTSFPMPLCDRSLENQHVATGIVGLFNCLRSAYEENAFFVYSSSISVYGIQEYTPIDEKHPVHPLLLYGATKLAGEYYCDVMYRNYDLPLVILRFSDLYGPRCARLSAPLAFLLNCLQDEPIIIKGGGKQVRTYTYIKDAVDATILAVCSEKARGEVINVAGDESISIYDLANLAQDVTGKSPGLIILDDSEDIRQYRIDNRKAKQLLNFYPQVKMSEGLKLTWDWLQENYSYYL